MTCYASYRPKGRDRNFDLNEPNRLYEFTTELERNKWVQIDPVRRLPVEPAPARAIIEAIQLLRGDGEPEEICWRYTDKPLSG